MQFCSVAGPTHHIVHLVTVKHLLFVYRKLLCLAPSAFIVHQRLINQAIKIIFLEISGSLCSGNVLLEW
jgi:hypothetical protein